SADVEEGADLVHRLYVSLGYLDAKVEKPLYHYAEDGSHVDATIPITEGRQYFFGNITFTGQTIYDSQTLQGQMLDLVEQPYTDGQIGRASCRERVLMACGGGTCVRQRDRGIVELRLEVR